MPSTRPSPGLGPMLFECARLLDEIAQAEVNRQAGARVLTPALVRLLPHLTTEGVRPTEIARRIDVSKQAVGQALADLERRGFVAQAADPADGRARLVRLTAAGRAAFAHGHAVLGFYEAALATRVGQARIDSLKDVLDRVYPVLAEWSASGAPADARAAGGGAGTARPARRSRASQR